MKKIFFYLGKGLEFEKKVPFKLLSEYVEILGGQESSVFGLFRKEFFRFDNKIKSELYIILANKKKKNKHLMINFRGFKAAIKHQDKILLLVKMMYSSHQETLPCFETGKYLINLNKIH